MFESNVLNFLLALALLIIGIWLVALYVHKRDFFSLCLKIVSAVLLLIAIFDLPYVYYDILRSFISLSAIYFLIHVFISEIDHSYIQLAVLIVYIYMLRLFNPIWPVWLDKSTWIVYDIIAALIFLVHAVLPKLFDENSDLKDSIRNIFIKNRIRDRDYIYEEERDLIQF